MRPGNNNRRGRNRGPRKPHGGIPNKNQSFDGGGSETRVRGNVYQVLEKYLQLARDAGVSGDRIAAENYLQHADHYYRVIQSMNDGQRPRVGGRDISVADFNVQNVSQGLSAALYTGGQAPQANIAESGAGGAAAPSAGTNPGSGNANFSGGNDRDGNGQSDDDDDGDDVAPQGNRGGRQRSGNRQGSQGNFGNAGPNGQNARPQQGNQVSGGNQTAEVVASNEAQSRPSAPVPGRTVEAANGAQPADQPVVDEQPDYPEDLLPPVAAANAADDGRGPRPRGRLRGRRPRPAGGDAGADAGADAIAPVTEGSE